MEDGHPATLHTVHRHTLRLALPFYPVALGFAFGPAFDSIAMRSGFHVFVFAVVLCFALYVVLVLAGFVHR